MGKGQVLPHEGGVRGGRASGKIILFGEHAVVYGEPALAVPVKKLFAEAKVSTVSRAGIWISAPDIRLYKELPRLPRKHPLASVVDAVFAALDISPPSVLRTSPPEGGEKNGIKIKVTSTIPIASGLGSGAAVSVAIIRALSAYLNSPLNDEKVNEIAYEIEKIHHGTPSGIDNTVITYEKPVFFQNSPLSPRSNEKAPPPLQEKPIIKTLQVAKPFTILIANTGIHAPTKKSVADVRKLWEEDTKKIETLFTAIGSITRTARQAIEGGHPERLGALMNENHRILQEVDVSCQELDRLTEASLNAGALGAKLSGGGRGGNMIALSTKENTPAIAEALLKSGAKNVIVTEIK